MSVSSHAQLLLMFAGVSAATPAVSAHADIEGASRS